ncbi:MAG TPA: hypothetical protein VEJ43_11930 [Pseudolabrys sp.]|nr:hypothetical protein [Pseudolabrys sp.]
MLALAYLTMLAGLYAVVFNLRTVLDVLRQTIAHVVPRRRFHSRLARVR